MFLTGSHYTRLISFSLWVIMILIIAGCSLSTNYSGPPIDLILENVNSTDETVVLEVEGMTKVQEDDSYATWKINATVVKSFKGKLTSGENIEYFRTVETDLETTQQGSRHLVSFVWKGNHLIIPDVGYHFESSLQLEKHLTAALQSP